MHEPAPPTPPAADGAGTPEDAALDPSTLAAIADALEPDAIDPREADRLRRRVLGRIAASTTAQHVTVQPGPEGWQPFGAGLQLKVLHEAAGVMSYLVRMAPGSSLPAHRHPVDEECVVLEGEVHIGSLRVPAGGFHLGRADLLHDRLGTDTGALIFLRGAVPDIALVV